MVINACLLSGLQEHLHPGSEQDPDDPALCDDLDAFINGGSLSDLSRHYKVWTEALARIKLQE